MIWEKYVYKFVLFSLSIGLLSTIVRVMLVLANGTADVVDYVGGPIAICFEFVLLYLLWGKPQSLRLILHSMYGFMTVGISVKLGYFLFFGDSNTFREFVHLSPWMFINYIMPFFIFGHRAATIVSSIVFGVWMMTSAVYIMTHLGSEGLIDILSIFSQTYFAQFILIVFVSLYARLQAFYLDARESAGHMERMAKTDFLLGIENRRSMQLELTMQMEHAEKHATSLSVILLDIDHFKQINDTYGHHVGDAVLIEVSSVLSRTLDGRHTFGRWGGEEFLIVLPNCSMTDSYQCAEKTRKAIEAHHFQSGQVTSSFGVTEYRSGDSPHSLLKRVDDALYRGKQSGRNRVEVS